MRKDAAFSICSQVWFPGWTKCRTFFAVELAAFKEVSAVSFGGYYKTLQNIRIPETSDPSKEL